MRASFGVIGWISLLIAHVQGVALPIISARAAGHHRRELSTDDLRSALGKVADELRNAGSAAGWIEGGAFMLNKDSLASSILTYVDKVSVALAAGERSVNNYLNDESRTDQDQEASASVRSVVSGARDFQNGVISKLSELAPGLTSNAKREGSTKLSQLWSGIDNLRDKLEQAFPDNTSYLGIGRGLGDLKSAVERLMRDFSR